MRPLRISATASQSVASASPVLRAQRLNSRVLKTRVAGEYITECTGSRCGKRRSGVGRSAGRARGTGFAAADSANVRANCHPPVAVYERRWLMR